VLLLTLCLLSEAQRPFVPVAPGETLHVESRPDSGRPIAIIPGLFGAAFTFRKVVPLLVARGFRPIVIEPLGTGFSSRPEKADYSLDAQSHRLAAVLERFGEPTESSRKGAAVRLRGGERDLADVVRALDAEGIAVEHIQLHAPSLDDVFLAKTGRSLEGAGAEDEERAAEEPERRETVAA